MEHINYPPTYLYARKTALYALYAIVVGVVCCLFFGCKSIQYVERVEKEYVHDTLNVKVVERQSIHIKDSTSRVDRGDTVWVDRWHWSYRDRLVHDTTEKMVYVVKTDSVPYPVEVEKELSWPESAYLDIGRYTWWIWLLLLLIGVLWIAKKVYMRR